MKVGTPGFIGERLREAREARGLTATALASVLGVTTAAITQYETGAQTPRPDVMERIGLVLRLPASFFLTARIREAGVVFWRSLESATRHARVAAERRLGWVQDIAMDLSEHLELCPLDVPIFDLPRDPLTLTDDSIDTLAAECRRYWGIGDGPIQNVSLLLECKGIVLAREDLQDTTLDALSKWCPDARRAYCLVSSGKDSAVRARFNLLHELGHLVLHRGLDRWHLENKKLHRLIESQAHRFASAMGMPTEAFASDVYSLSIDSLLTLKAKWKFSVAAMIKRCEGLGMLREETSQKLWRGLATRGWRAGEPLDDELPHEHPQALRGAIAYLLDQGIVTEAAIPLYFNLPWKDVSELTGARLSIDDGAKIVSMLPSKEGEGNSKSTRGARVIRFEPQGRFQLYKTEGA